MPYLIIRHKVTDFDKWHSVFKSHDEAQRKAGLKDPQLLRDASNPDIVVCFFRVDDIDKAEAFTETPHSKKALKESGIIGEPEILLLHEI